MPQTPRKITVLYGIEGLKEGPKFVPSSCREALASWTADEIFSQAGIIGGDKILMRYSRVFGIREGGGGRGRERRGVCPGCLSSEFYPGEGGGTR